MSESTYILVEVSAYNSSADKGERSYSNRQGIMSQRKTEKLFDAGKEVPLEVNTKKIMYMFMSRCQNPHKKIGNIFFASVV